MKNKLTTSKNLLQIACALIGAQERIQAAKNLENVFSDWNVSKHEIIAVNQYCNIINNKLNRFFGPDGIELPVQESTELGYMGYIHYDNVEYSKIVPIPYEVSVIMKLISEASAFNFDDLSEQKTKEVQMLIDIADDTSKRMLSQYYAIVLKDMSIEYSPSLAAEMIVNAFTGKKNNNEEFTDFRQTIVQRANEIFEEHEFTPDESLNTTK